jgi:HAMP domain-containing protein
MTQHINLLSRRRAHQTIAWMATRGLTGLVVLLVLWGLFTEVSLQKLSRANDEVQQTMVALQAELEQKRREAGLDDVQTLAKDSARMRHNMEQHYALMQLVQKGEVGSLSGHASTIQILASTPQSGVWLQGVDITNAGQAMTVSGTAFTSTAVMQYAEQLNQAFQAMNIGFSSLEMLTEDVPGASSKNQSIKFKLH